MKRFAAIIAILLATTAAQASDTYSFDIGGQSVTIDAPKDCSSADCVSISIPGVFEYNTKRIRRDRDNREGNTAPREERVRPAPPPIAQPAQPTPAPAPVAVAPAAPSTTVTPPAPSGAAPSNAPAAAEPAKQTQSTVAANTPAADPTVKPAPTPVAAASPLGIWMTEKNEGKIRIENCGNDICGYAMDKKTEANGEKILINMKPGDSKWAGKIYDPKSGSTYDSTIALKDNDSLRVQGCAFGGMFCGGQTWTRVN